MNYERLLEACKTDRQREVITAHSQELSNKATAKALGISRRAVEMTVAKVKKATDEDPQELPPGPKRYTVDPITGKQVVAGGWDQTDKQKSKFDQEKQFEEALKAFKKKLPKYKTIKPLNIRRNSDLLNLYVLTDAHVGMLAWHEEGGADWDLDIAENTIIEAFKYLLHKSPKAEYGFFCNLADLLHYDGMLAMTNASGHILDSDTRPFKLMKAVVRICRAVLDMMLKKYDKVICLNAQGNHDERSSMWLGECIGIAYEKNKRFINLESPNPYYAWKHGKILLGFTHGHKAKCKLGNLEAKFNAEFRDMLGGTTQTLIHTGHKHSWQVDGNVEQHPTLAARDYYASSNMYHSLRGMRCITYHQDLGEVERMTFNPVMLEK